LNVRHRIGPAAGEREDVERHLIRTRTAEGRSRAKAQGQQMGRPGATEGSHPPPRAGRDVAGVSRQLRTAASPPCAARRGPHEQRAASFGKILR
jgi:hypothetical protein